MPYTIAYQASFQSFENEMVDVTIYDTASFTDAAVDMTISALGYGTQQAFPAGVFKIKTVDDERNVFKSIRAKQATLTFFSSNFFDITLFSQGADDRFLVVAVLRTTNTEVFRGFLVMDDHNRPFMPHPNPVTLTATDNLGTLKDVALTDFTGVNPKGKFTVAQFVAWALAKTNLKLPILFCSTWYEETNPDHPWWDVIYLDAKTFETEIGVSEDCYTVLEKILGFDCMLTQYRGTWFVSHIDEMDQVSFAPYRFTSVGVYSVQDSNFFPQKLVGSVQPIRFIQEDQIISYVRPHKSVTLNYQFTYPKEIIDNIDFSRGSVYTPLVPSLYPFVLSFAGIGSFPSPGDVANLYLDNGSHLFYKWNGTAYQQLDASEIPSATGFHIDDWTLVNLTISNPTPTAIAYIERIYQLGYEKERYIVFSGPISINAIRSNRIPMMYKDRFSISIDRRVTQNLSGSGSYASAYMIVKLYGDNGTYWLLTNGTTPGLTPQWLQSNSTFTLHNTDGFIFGYFDRSSNLIDWISASVDAPPIPASGEIEVYIVQSHDIDGADTHFSNLQFTYTPFINGSYQKYTSITRSVSQPGNYKSIINDNVLIYDNIRTLFKGAMLKLVSGKYVAAGRFYAGGDLARQGITGTIPPQYFHPFAHLQIYALWNKSKRMYSYVNGTLLGLRLSDGATPDMNSVYLLDDAYPGFTNNKKFVATDLDQDFDSCQWTATLLEISDVTMPNSYEDVDAEIINYLT